MPDTLPDKDFRYRNVYIVEDDEAVRDSLRILLGLRCCRVHDFADAQAFLAAGRAQRPACLLVDVKLPGRSGLELQAQVEQDQPDLPVIRMTGHGDVAMARAALRAGALDFIEKPINDDELLAAIELALSGEMERIDKRREREEMLKRLAQLTAARNGGLPASNRWHAQPRDCTRIRHQPAHGGSSPRAAAGQAAGGPRIGPVQDPVCAGSGGGGGKNS